MSNSLFFRTTVVEYLLQQGYTLFGGAVRDLLSGDFYSSDWDGDLDVLVFNSRLKIDSLLLGFLRPGSVVGLQSLEEISSSVKRAILFHRDREETIQVDFVDKDGVFTYNNYTGESETEGEFLDLDVNGLVMGRYGISLREDVMRSHHGITVFGVLKNIKNKQFFVLKSLSEKREAKAKKLTTRGWQWLS